MLQLVIALLVLLSILVAALIAYFGDVRRIPWYALVTSWIAWLGPFTLPLILSVDLSSTQYRKCLEAQDTTRCDRPLAYVDYHFLYVYWRVVYWSMFALTWVAIPLMETWIESGEFRIRARIWHVIRARLYFFAYCGIAGVVAISYLWFYAGFQQDALLSLGIAAANAWGLLLTTCLMGYGLVEVPRMAWFWADAEWGLQWAEVAIVGKREELVDSEAEFLDRSREIAIASARCPPNHALRPYCDILLQKCPGALNPQAQNITAAEISEAPQLSERYLADLRAAYKRAVKLEERNREIYVSLVKRAKGWEGVRRRKKGQAPLTETKEEYRGWKTFAHGYMSYVHPYLLRLIAIIAAIASVALVWSESTFQIQSPTLSIPALMLKDANIGYGALETMSILFILYMCITAYSTLFQIRYFDNFVVPNHHTDANSLLFVGRYLCKLTFPLCYNFLNLVGDDETVFVEYQGHAVQLTPLLGPTYNTWLPLLVLLFAILTLTHLHVKIARQFGWEVWGIAEQIRQARGEAGRMMEDRRREGRSILEMEWRRRGAVIPGASNDGLNNTHGSGGGVGGTRTSGGSSRTHAYSATARDLLRKYQARGVGGTEDTLATSSTANDSVAIPVTPPPSSELETPQPKPSRWNLNWPSRLKPGGFQRLAEDEVDVEEGKSTSSRASDDFVARNAIANVDRMTGPPRSTTPSSGTGTSTPIEGNKRDRKKDRIFDDL
ncbi:hypothetical protein HDU85_003974 [Gaertneriomyces sp. JEL0708]|nr:hypothetical protein HDU85_003974 [Gaertneriomyces sp. JEL0708]